MTCSFLGSSVHVILQEKILEWVAISFSSGFSQPRDQTRVLHIAGRFFTILATKEASEGEKINRTEQIHQQQELDCLVPVMGPGPGRGG